MCSTRLLGGHALGKAACLVTALFLTANPGGTQQPEAVDPFQAQYDAIEAQYVAGLNPLFRVEKQRQIDKKEQDPAWWPQVAALTNQFDQQFFQLLKAAISADLPAALRLYFRWERGQLMMGARGADATLVAQIEAVKPDVSKVAGVFISDTANSCTEANAMEIISKMVSGAGDAAHGGVNVDMPQLLQQIAACAAKATLVVDFDSELEGTLWFPGDFPTSKAHVHADGVRLKYDVDTDRFIGRSALLTYVSYDFTRSEFAACDDAHGVSGTIDIIAKMTETEGAPREYVLEFFPEVKEIVESPKVKWGWRHDKQRLKPGCPSSKVQEDMREFELGFSRTGGVGPVRLRLGNKQVFNGTDYTVTAPVTIINQRTTVALHTP